MVLVTAAERTMNTAPMPTEYTRPGPPMKANPDSVDAMAATASVTMPTPLPATK